MRKSKVFLLQIFSFCIANTALSQQLISLKNHCGLYCKTIEQVQKQFNDQLKFYDFHSGEMVASIGAQCANWEAIFASRTDSVTFYLEDIDSASLNEKQVSFAWAYYSSLRGKPITCDYKIVIGTETTTNLPDNAFDKIVVINSFHEFTDKQQMLADIRKKLKPDGILMIDETLAQKSGELHIQCKKRIYTDEEMVAIFKENGFMYLKSADLHFRNAKPVRKIFAFKKS
jgi:SAM-dependent methyltransferase